jgi:hypothetical protein
MGGGRGCDVGERDSEQAGHIDNKRAHRRPLHQPWAWSAMACGRCGHTPRLTGRRLEKRPGDRDLLDVVSVGLDWFYYRLTELVLTIGISTFNNIHQHSNNEYNKTTAYTFPRVAHSPPFRDESTLRYRRCRCRPSDRTTA